MPAPSLFLKERYQSVWVSVLLVLTLTAEALITYDIFYAFAFCHDEYDYLLQAKIFAQGKLALPIDSWREAIVTQYTIYANGHFFSKYPPGFSAVLSLGVLAGIPELVNPLLSTATILVLFYSLRLRFGFVTALVSSLIIATNSYFLGYGASLFSQPLCLFLTSLALLVITRYEQVPRGWHLFSLGVISALTFLTRPLDGGCLFMAALLATTPLQWRALLRNGIPLGIPLGLAVLGLYLFNWLTSGCICITHYDVYGREFSVVKLGSGSVITDIYNTVVAYIANFFKYGTHLFLRRFLTFVGPGFFLLMVAGMSKTRGVTARFSLSFILLILAFYNLHDTAGYPIYGARYWYICIAPMAFFVAGGLQCARGKFSPRVKAALLGLLIAYQLFQLAGDLESYRRRFLTVFALQEKIAQQCDENSIIYIFFGGTKEPGWSTYILVWSLSRNGEMNHLPMYVLHKDDQLTYSRHNPNAAMCNYDYELGTIAPIPTYIPHLNPSSAE